MRRKTKVVVLSLLAIALLLWASLETFHLYSAFHHLSIPNNENRGPFGHSIHNWMSVEELAESYGVPVAEIFAALAIEPEPNDEQLSLKHLGEKYKRSPAEMVKALDQFARPDRASQSSGGL
jgi:hypothetical protein